MVLCLCAPRKKSENLDFRETFSQLVLFIPNDNRPKLDRIRCFQPIKPSAIANYLDILESDSKNVLLIKISSTATQKISKLSFFLNHQLHWCFILLQLNMWSKLQRCQGLWVWCSPFQNWKKEFLLFLLQPLRRCERNTLRFVPPEDVESIIEVGAYRPGGGRADSPKTHRLLSYFRLCKHLCDQKF